MVVDLQQIQGISLIPLKIITGESGTVMHNLKKSDSDFAGFGEAYFSTVMHGAIKGWKRHNRMILNITVPVGSIKFIIYDDRKSSQSKGTYGEVILSPANYFRLTVQPGLWMAFEGVSSGLNLLLNVASIEHDPGEADNRPFDYPGMPKIGVRK